MEERLKFIFGNVNEWLRFAEAKNGVLIAFNGAAIWGILQSFTGIQQLSACLTIPVSIFMCCAFVGIVVSFFSFMPALTLSREVVAKIDKKLVQEKSVVFFRHIGDFNADEYFKLVEMRSEQSQSKSINPYHLDLASQIVANARNTWLKYKMFYIALNVTLAGMILPIPFQIFFWIKKVRNTDAKSIKLDSRARQN
ncbi:MAG: hypothetical protein JNJ75_17400 [Cyclobacteriaceae bacterium]|nr:hypothetical protein [Cyclobacteriaceae bacterium]